MTQHNFNILYVLFCALLLKDEYMLMLQRRLKH